MRKTARRNLVRQVANEGLELKALLREGARALVVSAGLRVMDELLEQERTELCGTRYEHLVGRVASRGGYTPGELILGGRRVQVQRPRVRGRNGHEVSLPSWELATREDPLGERAVEQMVLGVSTRRYERSLEELPVEVKSRGTSKSAVSRRFVSATRAQLDTWLSRPLAGFDLVAILIDGVHFADHVVLVAMGIDAQGAKQVLGFREGATENAVACTELLTSLRDRGLPTDRSMLFILDGAKALAKAVRDVFGERALLQRCQVHKKRNVLDQLPEHLQAKVKASLSEAYGCGDAAQAKKWLTRLADQLQGEHPSAAGSLREGLDETLTVMGLDLPRTLERSLSTTNIIESLMGRVRTVTRNVKRWRGGGMILRWMAASAGEAAKGFRRIKGHADLSKLVAVLRARDAERTIDRTRKVA